MGSRVVTMGRYWRLFLREDHKAAMDAIGRSRKIDHWCDQSILLQSGAELAVNVITASTLNFTSFPV
jgi:hypothetical protein